MWARPAFGMAASAAGISAVDAERALLTRAKRKLQERLTTLQEDERRLNVLLHEAGSGGRPHAATSVVPASSSHSSEQLLWRPAVGPSFIESDDAEDYTDDSAMRFDAHIRSAHGAQAIQSDEAGVDSEFRAHGHLHSDRSGAASDADDDDNADDDYDYDEGGARLQQLVAAETARLANAGSSSQARAPFAASPQRWEEEFVARIGHDPRWTDASAAPTWMGGKDCGRIGE